MIEEKFVLFLCGVIKKKLGQVVKQMILLKDLLLNNYIKEELMLRKGSNFVFESAVLLSDHIHTLSLLNEQQVKKL